MATLTVLAAGHGFTVGDLDTSGQYALQPAYQKIYFADGRASNDNGYHKLDFLNTKITATDASAAFTKGEVVTQTSSGATGIYDENPSTTLLGTVASGPFTVGELVTQATSNARGYVINAAADGANPLYVYVTSGTFVTSQTVTGATSGATTTVATSVSATGKGHFHLIYRTTTTEFDNTNVIKGASSGSTMTSSAVTAPPHWIPWVLTTGTFPDGGSNIMALCWGRIFMNSIYHPHQWFATRINNPLDLLLVVDDVASAQNSQATKKAGLVGDQLIAMIPYKGNTMVFGCLNNMFVMRADPAKGGFFTTLSDTTGIFSDEAYCWDDKNNLYFMGSDGIYGLTAAAIIEGQPPTNLTKEHLPKLISNLGLNRRTDRVTMAYDKDRYGIEISVSQNDGVWSAIFWLDLRTGGVFPEEYQEAHTPTILAYFDSRVKSQRTLLAGCNDGYIRKWDELTKSDDGDAIIESEVLLGPIAGQNIRAKVSLDELSIRTGIDTDSITASVYSGLTAQHLIKNVIDDESPKVSKTFAVDKLLPSIRQHVEAMAIGIKLSNDSVASSWSMEKIDTDIKESGRSK